MRLASDCMQLAGDAHSPALQSHFLRMAREWTTLRNGDRARILRLIIELNGFTQPTRGLRNSRPPALQYEVDAGCDVRTRDNLFLEGLEPAGVRSRHGG